MRTLSSTDMTRKNGENDEDLAGMRLIGYSGIHAES